MITVEIAPGLQRWTAWHGEWGEEVGCVHLFERLEQAAADPEPTRRRLDVHPLQLARGLDPVDTLHPHVVVRREPAMTVAAPRQ